MANPPAQVPLPPIPQLPNPTVFDPSAQLPARLQLRIDSWQNNPPASQFQTYGPISGYLHNKFPSDYFLIKPQAYLSSVSKQLGGHHRIDSHGTAVDQDRQYPDFTVCQFFGADSDNTPGDVVRVVYEIGTKTDPLSKLEVLRQLRTYLQAITARRCDEWLLGVGQVGNEVYLFSNQRSSTFLSAYPNIDWISLFDHRFTDQLNQIRDLGYANDQVLSLRQNV
ncbi:hypothetical protein MSAN_02401400 [Mycena sanguinolenta]|uniref:Uncharacterized protein n=1 Tax=Mycena sanguinolenta TaxID=230812 RepID=A0A8H6X3Q1_9AGAR|nr:hypothetical protein MSAN_02401400 [Mycena sanguinolenta]